MAVIKMEPFWILGTIPSIVEVGKKQKTNLRLSSARRKGHFNETLKKNFHAYAKIFNFEFLIINSKLGILSRL